MAVRFYNARLDETNQLVELWTEGERISYIGQAAPLPQGGFSREIDCRGGLLLPGFKNAHAHSAMVVLRSAADDKPLSRWLYEDVLPRENRLTPEDIYELCSLAFMEYVSGGITAAFDMYLHIDAAVQCAVDRGFRFVLCDGMNDFGGTPESARKTYEKYNNFNPLISARLGFHAEYTSSEPLLMGLSELSHQLKAPVFAHNSETRDEVNGCIERHGCTPTAYMEKLGLFDYGGGGFHCVHLNAADRRIFSERGLYAVTCPAANLKLASGIAPIHELYGEGVKVAVGTDGAAGNNALDFFRELYLVSALQKQLHGAESTPAERVLHSACITGAEAMGLTDCNALAVGKYADLVLIDLNSPNMRPRNAVLRNLVYAGSKQNVALTMIAGRVVYERGTYYMGLDPERVYNKADEIAARIQRDS